MTTHELACIVRDPPSAPDAAVLWLHGLGADGNDFVPAIPFLGLPADHGIRFLFPTARAIPVTINGGVVMPAWYDILHLDLDAPDRNDAEGLARSVAAVRHLLDREVEGGIPAERIVVAGFSQGGAVAFELALTHPDRLAGLVAMSTYVVDRERIIAGRTEANAALPILQCHGAFDPMVPVTSGQRARAFLEGLGHGVDWHEYPIQHEVSPTELRRVGSFLAERLAR